MSRRIPLGVLLLITALGVPSWAQQGTRSDRSVLVPFRGGSSSEERVARRLNGEPTPAPLADVPDDEPAPAVVPEAMPQPPGFSSRVLDGVSTRRTRTGPIEPRIARGPAAPAAAPDQMVLTSTGASLRVDAVGPQSISIGKPATYRVRAQNLTEIDAQEVSVRVTLPSFVEVAGGQPSVGDAQRAADAQGGGTRLTWNVGRITANSTETLELQLIPRESTPFEVKLEWAARPVAATARVMVRQPELAIQIEGPGDVLFGTSATYKITVSNPGTGDAENVTLHVASGEAIQSKQFGLIRAGEQEVVELELTAREAGELLIEAAAIGDGELETETSKPVVIRKAELTLAVVGPEHRFAGQDAEYRVEFMNTGDAPATALTATVQLPNGAQYTGGINGAQPEGGRLRFRLPDMAPGAKLHHTIQCLLPVAGEHTVQAQVASGTEVMANGHCVTMVESIADLKLTINDPTGPVPTGKDVVYEIKVANRGTREAEQVRVIAQFSEGIEPVGFEGQEAEIVPGQVLFAPLPLLRGGETLTLRVVARASTGVTHTFRATVTCSDEDVHHVAEETTRYYNSGSGASAGAGRVPPAAPRQVPGAVPVPGNVPLPQDEPAEEQPELTVPPLNEPPLPVPSLDSP